MTVAEKLVVLGKNASSGQMTFEDLSNLQDSDWIGPIAKEAYLVYLQAIGLVETVKNDLNREPIGYLSAQATSSSRHPSPASPASLLWRS